MRRLQIGLFALGLTAGSSVSADAAGDDCTHEVSSGDTLSAIALEHGTTQAAIKRLNPKLAKNPDQLRLGDQIKVCEASPSQSKSRAKSSDDVDDDDKGRGHGGRRCGRGGSIQSYEVKSGDTLSKIASKLDVDESAITSHNAKLKKNPDLLRVGDAIDVCTDERAGTPKKSKLCDMRTPVHMHEVVPGEHLGQIAGRYGVSRSELVAWNRGRLPNPDMLKVGTELRVCPEIVPHERKKITYTVAPGDTFGEIAKKYDLTRRELEMYQRGKVTDTSALRDGQELVVWVDGQVVPGFGDLDDDKGTLSGGIQLPAGRHYHVKWEAAAWGTATTVKAIQSAVSDYQRRSPGGPKIHIGDISKRGGGKFPPHLSHQHGRDVDVGYVLKGPLANETKFKDATEQNLDVARTWRLVKAFIDTGKVRYIFMDHRIQKLLYEHAKSRGASDNLLDELFQYPRGKGRTHGMIRHWKGHRNHFHVRFRRD